MDYEQFRLDVMEHIQGMEFGKRYWPKLYTDGYQPASDEEREFVRETNLRYHNKESDEVLEGDFIQLISGEDAPLREHCRFEVKFLYEQYQRKGWPRVEEIVRESVTQTAQLLQTSPLKDIEHFDRIRQDLILRPLPFVNRARLREHIYRKFYDIALVLYLRMGSSGGTLFSTKVYRSSAQEWGVSEEELLELGMANAMRDTPPRLFPKFMGVLPKKGKPFLEPAPDALSSLTQGPLPTALGTTSAHNGALALFYPGVQKRIGELYGCGYYAGFLGTDLAVLQSEGDISPAKMRQTLQDINRFSPETKLSDSVFYYDRARDTLTKV